MHSAASATFPRATGSTVANGAVALKHPVALAPCTHAITHAVMWVSGQRAAAEQPAALARGFVSSQRCVRRGGTDAPTAPRPRGRARRGRARPRRPPRRAAGRWSGAACVTPVTLDSVQAGSPPCRWSCGKARGGAIDGSVGLLGREEASRSRPPPPGDARLRLRSVPAKCSDKSTSQAPRSSITTLRGRHLQGEVGRGGRKEGEGPAVTCSVQIPGRLAKIQGKRGEDIPPLQKSKGLLRPSIVAWRESLQLARGAGAPAPRGSSRRPPWARSPWARLPSRPRRHPAEAVSSLLHSLQAELLLLSQE